MADEKENLVINVSLEITAASLQAIVENAKKILDVIQKELIVLIRLIRSAR